MNCSNLVVEKKISHGLTAEVFLVRDQESGTKFAQKKFNKGFDSQ